MGWLEGYLLAINGLGVAVYALSRRLSRPAQQGLRSDLIAAVALLGGSLGMALCLLLFDRKAHKSNAMAQVLVACVSVIHGLSYLFYKGYDGRGITFAFWGFFGEHKAILVCLILINLITFAAFGLDKYKAIKQKERIRIQTLLALSFFGGSLGGLAAMYTFRHKTKKDYFTLGLPLMVLMQMVIVLFVINF